MGFRSTFITNDFKVDWPDWIKGKYAGSVWFPADGYGPLASLHEAKTYSLWAELPEDIQKAIDWAKRGSDWFFCIVFLHECDGITRCEIHKDKILWTEPTGWRKTEGVEHDYCYGCSSASRASD